MNVLGLDTVAELRPASSASAGLERNSAGEAPPAEIGLGRFVGRRESAGDARAAARRAYERGTRASLFPFLVMGLEHRHSRPRSSMQSPRNGRAFAGTPEVAGRVRAKAARRRRARRGFAASPALFPTTTSRPRPDLRQRRLAASFFPRPRGTLDAALSSAAVYPVQHVHAGARRAPPTGANARRTNSGGCGLCSGGMGSARRRFPALSSLTVTAPSAQTHRERSATTPETPSPICAGSTSKKRTLAGRGSAAETAGAFPPAAARSSVEHADLLEQA